MKTGMRYNEEQILQTLQRVENGERIKDICRDAGVSEQTFFSENKSAVVWTKRCFFYAKQLELENARFKRLLAERDL
jgi:putative transposase